MSRIGIVAGEESGDSRAAALMQEILAREPGTEFLGAGGPRMAAIAGGEFDNWIAEAGVVGLWDVLRNYPYFRRKFSELRAKLCKEKPDAVIFVDYPGFNLRLAAKLRADLPSTKLIYYISPQVWAWNRSRIPHMARILDLMICIFPFEKPLYEKSGLKTVFSGHPLVEEIGHPIPRSGRDPSLLGLFPGSRKREIRKLFPIMLQAAKRIMESRPDIRFAAAASNPENASWLRTQASELGVECQVESGNARQLMQTSTAGLVCSGTATLEAALCGMPYALVYRVPWLTYEVGKRVIRVPYLGIVNILAGKPVVREFIQADCNPVALADEALKLFNSEDSGEKLVAGLREATSKLTGAGASSRAAEAVLETLRA